jgi:hypothetical protein
MRRTITAVAGERIEYGCFVTVAEGIARRDPEGRGEGGLATRPAGAGTRTAHEQGETVKVLTEGGALGQFGSTLRWAEIRDGRLLPPDFHGSR